MVPAARAARHHPYADPVVHHRVDERAHLVGIGTGVALPHALANAQIGFRVIDDLGATVDGHSAQGVVALPVLDHHGDGRVATQVHRLLRFGLGLEPDLPVHDGVPHRDQVRPPVGQHGGHGGCPAAFDEFGDLLV